MTRQELRRVNENLSDEQREQLVEARGGCSCHRSPPCWAHSEELTEEEALDMGFITIEAEEGTDQ